MLPPVDLDFIIQLVFASSVVQDKMLEAVGGNADKFEESSADV